MNKGRNFLIGGKATQIQECDAPPSLPPPPSPPPPSYAFADKASLRAAIAAYNANAASATATYGPISSWGVSAVTDMNGLFANYAQFNADISSWDTSSVTDMATMFQVRYARAPPSADCGGCLRHRPPCPTLPPACRPSSYVFPFLSAARVCVQPAAEP